jgi:outer membrane receptor protein involved in Fe transport
VNRNVFQMLQGRVAGVQISGDPQNPVINIRGTGRNGTTSIQNNVDPVILVDGVQTDVSMAAAIPIANVETVDVIKGLWSSMIYGGSGGMIAIYTKQGSIEEARALPGLTSFLARGYSINKEYYRPNYDKENNLAEPDYRATLHWEPMIRIDSSGAFSLKYFNSDLENEIQIQVEGVTDSGEPLIAGYRYSIKK